MATGDGLFRGHPRGLFYLAFTEAWERFSYYGMTALLALYMIDQLLLPGHVEHVAGFESLRHSLEFFAGPLSNQALAARVVGLYTGFVYFTPLLGGLIADRWIGQRNAVVIGAVSMAAGHLAMAFDRAFLPALLLLVVGSGLLKGNISAQVGALYPPDDEARRNHGFVIFSTGINVGSVLGPLLCGLLAQLYGWHYGFGVAAVFMMLGLVTYLRGYRYLPARVDPPASASGGLTRADWHIIAVLGAVTALSVFQSTGFYQVFNVFPVWVQQRVQPTVAGFHVPIPWYVALNSFICIVAVPPLLWTWRQQTSRGGEPEDVTKIGIGAWLTAGGNLMLVAASVRSGRCLGQPGMAAPVLCDTGRRIPLSMADASGARVAIRPGHCERDHDRDRVHEPLRFEHPDRVDRRVLRTNEPRDVLGHSRRDCRGGRVAAPSGRATSYGSAAWREIAARYCAAGDPAGPAAIFSAR